MTKLSTIIENNIKENFENQNYISTYSVFRDFCLNSSDYIFITKEVVDERFKSVSFFKSYATFMSKDKDVEKTNEFLLTSLYSFILESCYMDALNFLERLHFSTEVASTIDANVLPRLDDEQANIKFETERDNFHLNCINGLYSDEDGDISKTDKMYKKIYKVLLDEAEDISNKIIDIVMSKKCSPSSYFVIKKPDCKTVVLFTDMETAIEIVDIDNFNDSMKELEFNEYEITTFVDKAVSIELNKRKDKMQIKIEDVYYHSNLSLEDLLIYL